MLEILFSAQENLKQVEKFEKHGQEEEVWVIMVEDKEIAVHFLEHVPDMALDFPFELDKFQKEAIYHIGTRFKNGFRSQCSIFICDG